MNIKTSLLHASVIGYRRWLSPIKPGACSHRLVHGGDSCSAWFEQQLNDGTSLANLNQLHLRLRECQMAAKHRSQESDRVIIPCVPFI